MKQSLVGYVCVCVFFEGGGALHPLMNMFIFGPKRNSILLLGASQCHVYGWRTGPFWCATFYLKVRRFPVKLLNPNYLGFSLICNQSCTSPLYLDSRFYKMKWSKRNIFVYRNVIVHGDVNPVFDREKNTPSYAASSISSSPSGCHQNLSFPAVFQRPVNTGAVGNRGSNRAFWNVPTKKMPTGHMFASKKYLDLDPEQFWTIAGSGWCLSNRLNIDGSHHFEAHEMCPWYSFQWSHNNGATVEMTWFSTQENAKKTCTVPPYQTFSLSSYCPGLCEAFKWEAWVFLSCAAKVCKGYPMKKSRTPSNSWFMIHDANFQAQIASIYLHHSWYCCMSSVCSFLLFLPLQNGPENSVSKVPLDAGFRKMQLALNG